ncbi:MAG: acyl-CoA dehydrogenase, partial [Betaproteobacteria bacterium]
MLTLLWFAFAVVSVVVVAYTNATGIAWTLAFAALLALSWSASLLPVWINVVLTTAFVLVAAVLNITALRRSIVSDRVLAIFRKVMPPMSQTERDAIEAGSVWWDAELFSGRPNWAKLLGVPPPSLTADEQHFLDHEVDGLCAMVTDWETTNVYKDLPPQV